MIKRADYDVDLSIPPELLEALREHEWRTLLTCMAEGHQWINRSHGQKQCKACGYYRSDVDNNGAPLHGHYAYNPDDPTLNMTMEEMRQSVDEFDKAAELAQEGME